MTLRPITKLGLLLGVLLVLVTLGLEMLYAWPSVRKLGADWREIAAGTAIFGYLVTSMATGYSPCYWAAILMAKCEAHQQMLLRALLLAGKHYREMYPDTEHQIRREMGASK